MSESTAEMLTKQLDSIAENIREYARQIESGEYGNRWDVQSADDPDDRHVSVIASDEQSAIADAERMFTDGPTEEWVASRDEFDGPTIVDEYGNETSIYDYPLEVVVKVGRPLAVVITTGGPHIEIVQDLGGGEAHLAGYWGGEKVYRHGSAFQTVLDYLTDAAYDAVPDEYK